MWHSGSLIFVVARRFFSVAACGISFPDQGSNPGPMHWQLGVLATEPPGKSLEEGSYLLLYNAEKFCGLFLLPHGCRDHREQVGVRATARLLAAGPL